MSREPFAKTEPSEAGPAFVGSLLQRRLPAIGLLGLVVLGVGLAGYALFNSPRGAADETGNSGHRPGGATSGEPLLTASATRLESHRNVAATSSTTSTNGDRVFDRTLAIYNLDDDLLMQRVGEALLKQLRGEGRFEKIRYVPAGKHLPFGERLPDVFVTLNKTSWEESGLPVNRRFKGKLVVSASDRFRRSSRSYSTTFSPPQVQYRWRAEINYSAKQTGIETPAARYQTVGRDLAQEIAKHLKKLLDGVARKHGTTGELPKYLYPEYIAPPAFDFVSKLNAKKLVDGPAFMKPALVVWQAAENRKPQEVVAAVGRSLADAGWKVPPGDDNREYLRATQGTQVAVVFREDDGRGLARENDDANVRTFVAYFRTMTVGEIDTAVRKMLKDGVDESVLLMFQNVWYRHRDLVEEYFSKRTPTQAASWLQLARFRKDTDPQSARDALLRANALKRIIHQQSPDSGMKKLAEELGVKDLPQRVSPVMMQHLGFKDLREPGRIEVDVRENEPAAIWLGDGEKEQSWLLVTPIRRRGVVPERTLRVQVLKLGKGSWSLSEQTTGDLMKDSRPVHTQGLGDGQHVEVFSEPIPKERKYRLTLRRTGGQASR